MRIVWLVGLFSDGKGEYVIQELSRVQREVRW